MGPQSQSVCEGGTVKFTCVLMFPSGATPGGAAWFTEDGGDAGGLPGHTTSNDLNGRPAPANVTSVLAITNVNISNNGVGYVCGFGFAMNSVASNASFLTVLGMYIWKFCFLMCSLHMHTLCVYHAYICTYVRTYV